MASGRARLFTALIVAALVSLVTAFGLMHRTVQPSANQTAQPSSTRRTLVMAHRGGAGLWPENTMYAFEHAASLGIDVLEMDVHATSDGVPVVIHDATVERTTNGTGRVNAMTLSELKRLDAAYRWTTDGGKSFPLRGRGITMPTLEEVFKAFPQTRLNIDIKQAQPSIVKSLCSLIRDYKMEEKVTIASFNSESLDEFRRECAGVATSASPSDLRSLMAMRAGSQTFNIPTSLRALQLPDYAIGRESLNPDFVGPVHARGLEIHIFTINSEADMRRLVALGVDGIITDYPDRLLAILNEHH